MYKIKFSVFYVKDVKVWAYKIEFETIVKISKTSRIINTTTSIGNHH